MPTASYDYEFSVWPVEQRWEAAIYEVFRYVPRILITTTEDEFRSFRDAIERSGFSLRETTRVPHYEPEPVS